MGDRESGLDAEEVQRVIAVSDKAADSRSNADTVAPRNNL